jgi:subtilase family serine protease
MAFAIWTLYYTFAKAGLAEVAPPAQARALVQSPVDETQRVTLRGNVRPEARPQFDRGAVADDLPMQHMWLQLKRSPEQQAALDALVEQLHTPGNPNYHQWLTPQEFGQTFGVAPGDIAKVTAWLQSHGMTINHIYTNGTLIDFSGTAGMVRDTFHTEIHNIVDAQGNKHIANIADPQVPAALAPVITGVVRLHDFAPHPLAVAAGQATRDSSGKWTRANAAGNGVKSDFSTNCPASLCNYSQTLNIVAPADFATIYNETPLLTAGTPITGKGQTIVMLEDSDMQAADFASFRAAFIPSSYTGKLLQTHPGCTDPGTSADEVEAAIDAEWAGAIAPDATVESASCLSTNVAFGGLIALQNLLNTQGSPSIYNLSFGECETDLGYAEDAAFNATYQQAAAQGDSVFVASGNSAGDSCDGEGAAAAANGLSLNGFASTPYNVAVGGTDFSDTYAGTTSNYWATTDGNYFESAKSYVPEVPWDNSCANALIYASQGYASGEDFCNSSAGERSFITDAASSGGASLYYGKPSYQAGFAGIVNDSSRDIPDISLFASGGIWGHSSVYCMSDTKQGGTQCGYYNTPQILMNIGGGTAFASSSMAGIQALINQKTGESQGNPNYVLYGLAKSSYGTAGSAACSASKGSAVSSSCIFHDVTQGDTSIPCLEGTTNCVTASTEHNYGVLSADGTTAAYQAATGYDMATGIGTPNIANLVNAWAAASGGAPTMTVVVAPYSVQQGKTIVVTATVAGSGSYPTGTIKLTGSGNAGTLGSVTLPMVPTTAPACTTTCRNGVNFSYTVPANLALGTYTVTANYTATSGEYSATTATTTFNVVANASSTTVTASPSTVALGAGKAITFTSTTSWTGTTAPTGTLLLTIPGVLSTSIALSGCTASGTRATCSYSWVPTVAGSYTATMTYSGDKNYATSSATAAINVTGNATSTSLSISPSIITSGHPTPVFTTVTKYTGTSAPTGQLLLSGNLGLNQFAYVPLKACTVNSAAKTVTCSYAYQNMWELWGDNAYTIYASYSGDTVYAASTSAATALTITEGNASTTTLTLSPSRGNYTVGTAITATLVSTGVSGKGRPTGVVSLSPSGLGFPVSFTLPGSCTATNSYTSTCTYTFTIPKGVAPGPYTIQAAYAGDPIYNPSTASLPLFVLPSISFSSVSHNFGSVEEGTTSSNYTLTMTNNMSVAYTPAGGIVGASNFVMTTNCPTSLAAGASCQYSFVYKPTSLGAQTASWGVSGGPADTTFYPSNGGELTGTGIAAAGVTLSTPGYNFGTQALGSVSNVYGAVLTNGTADPLSVTITLSGNTADFHTYAINCGATLAAGASCNLQYQFTPQSSGAQQELVGIALTDTVTGKAVSITSEGSTVQGLTLTGIGQ